MNALRILGLAGFLALLATVARAEEALPPATSQANAERAAERQRIQQEKNAIGARLKQAETACYQRFAVEDCLRAARRGARAERAVLHQRESLIDDAERRERAQQRLKTVEQRQAAHSAEERPAPRVAASRPARATDPAVPEQRARKQSEREASARVSQEKRSQALGQQAARKRQALEEKQQAAAERKARLLQQQEQEKARGHQPAAPLPQ